MRLLWSAICLVAALLAPLQAGDAPAKAKATTQFMPVMGWYHPVLEPGLSEVTLLCTVASAKKAGTRYGNPYWTAHLRIDERIYIDKAFVGRLEGVQFIDTDDFHERKAGERIVLFGGIGEKYDGEDFLKPCWSGTTTDLGILLFPKDDVNEHLNDSLLQCLRAWAKADAKADMESLEIFSEFCPKGVARQLLREKRLEEYRREEEEEQKKEKDQPQK